MRAARSVTHALVAASILVLAWSSALGCSSARPASSKSAQRVAEPERDAGPAADEVARPTAPLEGVDVETGFELAPPPYDELGARIRAQRRAGCDAGDHLACYELGKMLMFGEHGNRDHLRGWWMVSDLTEVEGLDCEADRPADCKVIGLMHEDNFTGEFVRDDAAIYFSRAAHAFEESCDKGDASACELAAELFARNWGGEDDLDSLMATLSRLCLTGSVEGCRSYLGFGSTFGGGNGAEKEKRRHLRRERRLLRRRCREQDAPSCVSLAWFHLVEEIGKGPKKAVRSLEAAFEADPLGAYDPARGPAFVSRDERVGRLYLETACRAGHAHACWQLGDAWRQGKLELESAEIALAALDRGCDGGNLGACRLAAEILEQDHSFTRLRSFRHRGCALGSSAECDRLSALLEEGRGGEPDPAAAERAWQRARVLDLRACDAGDPAACYRIAADFEDSDGLPRDTRLAWLYDDKASRARDRSCQAGDSVTCCSSYELLLDRDGGDGFAEDDVDALWEGCDCVYKTACCDVLEVIGQDVSRECGW